MRPPHYHQKERAFRGSSSNQDKITSISPKVLGESSESLKCSEVSTKKVVWRYFEFNYWFIKNWKNRFSKKMTFFHVFKEFLDDYFLYKKQILIMWIIREWRVNVIHNILFSNLCLYIGQQIFLNLVNTIQHLVNIKFYQRY